jgi:predicted O-methyltransferase YrrM
VIAEPGSSGFDSALGAIRGVKGWLTDDQARLLYERAAKLPRGARVVEIGTYHGRSTIVLAKAAPEAEIITIDPYTSEPDVGPRDLERFHANLEEAGVAARVRHLRLPSADALSAVEGEVDLLYIDGAHDLRTALPDIRGWGARVREGGTMLIHDSFSSVGVTIAQLLSLFVSSGFRYLGRSRTLAEYRREPLSGAQRVLNATRQGASLPWFLRNVAVKVALATGARPVARLLRHTDDVYPY